MSKGLGFSPADLQSGLKKLETSEAKSEAKPSDSVDKETSAEIQALKDIFNELNGDIEAIFVRYNS